MRCSACQHENREEAKFCEACGSNLTLACSSCGAQARTGALFCDTCGTALKTKSEVKSQRSKVKKTIPNAGARRQAPDVRPSVGERRQLTVMFCDLVGSTALSARMDPEEWQTVVQDYQRTCAEVIHRFDGHIAQYLGDGLLVYFGYPNAHEDDAQRAVRAALAIIAALQIWVPSPLRGEGQGEGEKLTPLQDSPHPSPLPQGARGFAEMLPTGARGLQVRIGIHTGLVVISEIGEGERREQLALGETPNVAARLQSVAEPNSVVVSGAAYRLIEGLFDCQDLGPLELKGVVTPVQAYRILGESAVRSRLEVAALRGLTPLVGREEEVSLLLRRWQQSAAGEGQVVLLSGEAGIGKSRLTQVLKDHISRDNHPRVEWRCSLYHQNSALYPVIEQIQHLLQFARDDSPEEKFRKLEVGARHASPLQADTISLLASLLTLPLPDRYPPLTFTPQRQKQKTLETLLARLLHEAQQQPVLVVVEDLHWVDPSTLELLSLLIDQVAAARVLVVLTFRPDFTPPWALAAHLTPLTLNRFARRQVEAMVAKVTSGRTLPAQVIQQIVEKTDGVPLFVEELTKTVVESVEATGQSPLQLAIPATLQDSLMARLDRLGPAKDIAQLSATIGREFTYELLRIVASVEEKNLQSALTKLVEAELLYQRGLPPTAHYTFKHALIQDTAYQSLLKSTRQQMHQRIAKVLEERFPETKETQPELLAHHYTEAGGIEQAIPYWQKAGEKAVQRSANKEAIGHLTKGLDLLKALSNTPERMQQELALQLALGASLMATKGYSAADVERVYARALALCSEVGETPQLFSVLLGLWRFYIARRDDYHTAYTVGEQCLALAQRTGNPARLLGAFQILGITFFYRGEFLQARVHLEHALALYDPQKHRAHVFRTGQDPGVACLSHEAWTLLALGYPQQAWKRAQEALTLAQDLAHPFSLAQALIAALRVHQHRGEGKAAQERAETLLTLLDEQGFAFTSAWGTVMRAWAVADQGQLTQGIAQMHQGLADFRATEAEVLQSYFLALLAEVYGKAELTEEGLTVLAEALTQVEKNDELFYEAELYRLKGELLLQKAEQMRREAEGERL